MIFGSKSPHRSPTPVAGNASARCRAGSREIRVLYFAYQSECGDHRLHERHWVSVHWCRQAGQTPPVSKVFHSLPQLQNHLSSLRGDQPQSGQRMRGGSEAPGFLSSSSSRSGTMTGLSATGRIEWDFTTDDA